MRDLTLFTPEFPKLKNYDDANKFLKALGSYLQAEILKQNEFVEIDFSVKKKHKRHFLTLDYDLSIGNLPKVSIATDDISDPDKFIISFYLESEKDGNVISERAKGGFPIFVLENDQTIEGIWNFLLDGNAPDLEIFEPGRIL